MAPVFESRQLPGSGEARVPGVNPGRPSNAWSSHSAPTELGVEAGRAARALRNKHEPADMTGRCGRRPVALPHVERLALRHVRAAS